MSAFCVYGMTLPVALKRAEAKLRDSSITIEEWNAKVREMAENILIQAAPTQVSPTFDAPPVRRGLDRGRPQDLAHLRTQGHGAQAQERQARQPSG